MTYVPAIPKTSLPVATTLAGADIIIVSQSGADRRTTLASLQSYVTGAGSTTTGGSTPTPSPTTPTSSVNPPTSNSSPVVRNTSSTPVAVSRVAVLSKTQPAFAGPTGSGESANGSEITSTSGSLKANDGTVFTLRDGGYEKDNNGNPDTNYPRGLCVFANGNDLYMKEGSSGHGLRFTEKVRWRTGQPAGTGPQIAIYSEGDWFISYGAPWTNCYLLGEDPNVTDTYVIPTTPPTGSQPFPLGARVANTDNPVYANWAAQAAAFLGPVQYINVFNVFGQGWSTWANAAGSIASNAKNNSTSGGMIPVIGIKLSDGKFYDDNNLGDPSGHDCNHEYRDIINGVHDTDITNVAIKWFEQYNLVYLRIAYEFNGTFMPDYFGRNGDTTTLNLWIAAFKKMADLWRATASARGKTVKIVWNPNANQYANNGVKNAYPGDNYVDVIGVDMYAPCYQDDAAKFPPGDPGLYNGDGTYSNSIKEWLTIDRNRVRWWDQGTAGLYYQNELENQFGFQTALDFIKLKGKPLMMCETGSGNREQWRNTGPCDDALFPVYLRSRLDQAVNMGIPVVAVMLWVSNESDGGWGCINGERRKQAQAWSAAFGGSTAATLLSPSGGGTTTSSPTTPSSTPSPTPTPTPSPTTPSTTSATAPSANSSAVVTALSGVSATLSLATTNDFYGSDTDLPFNVYFYLDSSDNKYHIGTSADSQVSSIVIRNGSNVLTTLSNATYSGSSSAPPATTTPTTSGTTNLLATVRVTDTSGHVATLALNRPPGMDFYGPDTGLTANIYYFIGNDGNAYITSSADGVISSAVVTRNGSSVTSLMPNTTYA